MLDVKQWNTLSAEEKALRADEMPQELKGKGQQPSPEDMKKLQDDVTKLTEKLEESDRGKSGLYTDLKEERKLRKELADKVKELEEKGAPAGEEGDLYLTLNKAKEMITSHGKDTDKKIDGIRGEFAKERELVDERRMKDKTDLPIPYGDAIKVFAQLAKANPTFWRQVQDEANTPGGKPAEVAYKIAVREHPDFVKKIKESTRTELIKDITKPGAKKLPAGGAGEGKPDYANMGPAELMKLDDKTLDKLAKGETP